MLCSMGCMTFIVVLFYYCVEITVGDSLSVTILPSTMMSSPSVTIETSKLSISLSNISNETPLLSYLLNSTVSTTDELRTINITSSFVPSELQSSVSSSIFQVVDNSSNMLNLLSSTLETASHTIINSNTIDIRPSSTLVHQMTASIDGSTTLSVMSENTSSKPPAKISSSTKTFPFVLVSSFEPCWKTYYVHVTPTSTENHTDIQESPLLSSQFINSDISMTSSQSVSVPLETSNYIQSSSSMLVTAGTNSKIISPSTPLLSNAVASESAQSNLSTNQIHASVHSNFSASFNLTVTISSSFEVLNTLLVSNMSSLNDSSVSTTTNITINTASVIANPTASVTSIPSGVITPSLRHNITNSENNFTSVVPSTFQTSPSALPSPPSNSSTFVNDSNASVISENMSSDSGNLRITSSVLFLSSFTTESTTSPSMTSFSSASVSPSSSVPRSVGMIESTTNELGKLLTSSLGMCLIIYTSILPPSIAQSSKGSLSSSNFQTSAVAQPSSGGIISASVLQSFMSSFSTVQSSQVQLSDVSISITSNLLLSTTVVSSSTRFLSSSDVISFTPSTIRTSSSIAPTSVTIRPSKHDLNVNLQVAANIDESSGAFRNDIETKLANTYNAAISLTSRRKRRAVTIDTTTIEVVDTKRNGENVNVRFNVIDGSRNTTVEDVVETFNYFSTAGLQRRLGYPVNSPISVYIPPTEAPLFGNVHVLGMLLTNTTNIDFDVDVRRTIENATSVFYKNAVNYDGNITTNIIYWKYEIGDNLYVEFYILANSSAVNASEASSQLASLNQTDVFNTLGWQVVTHPYASNRIPDSSQANWVIMKISSSLTSWQLSQNTTQESLVYNITQVFLTGQRNKQQSRRVKRALNSAVTQIVRSSSDGDQITIVFVIINDGVLMMASDAAAIMNEVSSVAMETIMGGSVILKPTPFLFSDVSTVPKKPEYWILAIVIIPAVMVILLCVFICWRCNVGATHGKTFKKVHVDMDEQAPVNTIDGSTVVVRGDTITGNPTKQLLAVPLSPAMSSNIKTTPQKETADDFRTSQRKKLRNNPLLSESIGRQNANYTRGISEAEEDGDVDDEYDEVTELEDSEEDDEMQLSRAPTPREVSRSTKVVESPIVVKHVTGETSSKPVVNAFKTASPKARPSRKMADVHSSPLFPRNDITSQQNRQDFNDMKVQQAKRSAGHIDEVVMVKDTDLLKREPPLRFRTNISELTSTTADTHTPPQRHRPVPLQTAERPDERKSFFLPSLNQHTQLTSAVQMPSDVDLRHKSDVERMRNKQRQREQSFNFAPSSSGGTSGGGTSGGGTSGVTTRRSWKRQQNRIDAILDPDHSKTAKDITSRKSRARRRLRRKNKIYIQPLNSSVQSNGIQMESLKLTRTPSPQDTEVESKPTNTPSERGNFSEAESDISMREARRRIHSLLDDTFSTLKKYKHSLRNKDRVTEFNPSKYNEKLSKSVPLTQTPINLPAALPEPPLSHGRTTAGFPATKRTLLQQNPYLLTGMNNIGLPVDQLLQWDPSDRQRYLSQNMGFPPYMGMPYPTGPNYQNLYVAPMQQHIQENGNPVWKRRPDFPIDDMYNQTRGNSLKSTSDSRNDRSNGTAVNISQPLVRAIKEELNRLSNAENNNRVYISQQPLAGMETSTV